MRAALLGCLVLLRAGAAAAALCGPGGAPARPVEAAAILLPGLAEVSHRQTGREVLLAVPGALPAVDAAALAACADGLLQGVSLGYDTLLLTLAPGVTLAVRDVEEGLRLELARAPLEPAAAAEDAPAEDPGALRLRLLEAELEARTGQFARARDSFEALRGAMPDSPEPLAGLAGLAARSGRDRSAIALYQEAQARDPEAPDLAAAIAGLARNAGPRLRADFEYRESQGGAGTGRARALIGGLDLQQPFGDGWRLGVLAEVAGIDAAHVQRRDGRVMPFAGTRERGELSVRRDWMGGQVVVGSLFLSEGTPGLGLRAELPDDAGATLLRAELRRPYWDFFQAMIDRATRDRVAAGRRQVLPDDLGARLEVGANRYGIAGDRDVGSTVSVNGELRQGNLGGLRGLSVAYLLEAEYLLRRDERTTAGGQRQAPLQLLDREVHAVALGYARSWRTDWPGGLITAELSAGYGVDRYGRAGPILGGAVGYAFEQFDLRLRGSHVENIGRARGTTTVFGGSLTWYF